jgi:LPXTG-site transpeptidase (sortase) family protein
MDSNTTYVATSVAAETRAAPPVRVLPLPPEPEPASPVHRRRAISNADILGVLGRGLTIFGVVIVAYVGYLYFASGLEHDRAQRSRLAAFNAALAAQRAPIGGLIAEGTPVAQLDIARVGVHETVVEGTTGRLLQGGPGHLRSSPLPGQAGNVVFAGRRVAFGGPFHDVADLRPGDEIVATTGQNKAKYQVTAVRRVDRNDADPVSPTSDNRLTLVTSAPPLFPTDRLVVIAQLASDPVVTPAARANLLRPDELGLQGDSTNALALLVWLQLLLVASCATVVLYRRFARWPTYLLAAPVIVLLLLLVFDSFTPLLPSTL